jgi:hypothetical protein
LVIIPTFGTQKQKIGEHMAKIGYGYGSECHLLRWMGRHRKAFDKTMLNTVGTSSNEKEIEWLDFGFSKEVRKWFD